MKFLFVILGFLGLLFLSLMGCKTKHPIIQSFSDSTQVLVVEKFRDTLIKIPFERAELQTNKSDKGTHTQTKGRAKITLTTDNDKINASCECDSLAIGVQLRDKYLSIIRNINQSEVKTNSIKHVPWYYQGFGFIGLLWTLYKIFQIVIKYLPKALF